jgi:hypothetical protein
LPGFDQEARAIGCPFTGHTFHETASFGGGRWFAFENFSISDFSIHVFTFLPSTTRELEFKLLAGAAYSAGRNLIKGAVNLLVWGVGVNSKCLVQSGRIRPEIHAEERGSSIR